MRSASRFYRLSVAYAVGGIAAVGVAMVAALRSLDLTASPAQLLAMCTRFLLPDTSLQHVLVLAIAAAAFVWRAWPFAPAPESSSPGEDSRRA